MANQNQCYFTGHIGNLEIRYTQDKIPITTFSLAMNKSKKYNDGQWVNQTTWIKCKSFNKVAEYINNYAIKGTFIRITAAYQENKWNDNSGQKRISPEFLVNEIEILGNWKDKNMQENQGKLNMLMTNQRKNNAIIETDFDDDIPF